jgi:hypothetical protein
MILVLDTVLYRETANSAEPMRLQQGIGRLIRPGGRETVIGIDGRAPPSISLPVGRALWFGICFCSSSKGKIRDLDPAGKTKNMSGGF